MAQNTHVKTDIQWNKSIFPTPNYFVFFFWILLSFVLICTSGDQTQGLGRVRQVLYHWAALPATPPLIASYLFPLERQAVFLSNMI